MFYVNPSKTVEFNQLMENYYNVFPVESGCYLVQNKWLNGFFEEIKKCLVPVKTEDKQLTLFIQYSIFQENPRFPENPYIFHKVTKRKSDTVMNRFINFAEVRDILPEVLYKVFSPTVFIRGLSEYVTLLENEDINQFSTFNELITNDVSSKFRTLRYNSKYDGVSWRTKEIISLSPLEDDRVIFTGVRGLSVAEGNVEQWHLQFDIFLPYNVSLFSNDIYCCFDVDGKETHFPTSEKYEDNITCLDLIYYVLNTNGETKSDIIQQAAKFAALKGLIDRDMLKKVIELGS